MAKYADLIAAQSDGVIHHWPMEELSGSDVYDVIGGWNAQVYTNNGLTSAEQDATVASTPAGHGRDLSANWNGVYQQRTQIAVLRFDQAQQHADLPAITVRLRYFHRSCPADTYNAMSYGLLMLGRGSSSGIYIKGSGPSNGTLSYGAGGAGGSGSFPFVAGQWHDIIISGDISGTDIYVDGALFGSVSGSGAYSIYDSDLTADSCLIGADDWDDGAAYLDQTVIDGIIQDFTIWNRKLSPAELSDLNTAGASEPLITDISPITYDAILDASFPISAEFLAVSNPVEVGIDTEFPITVQVLSYQDWIKNLPPVSLQEVYKLVITGHGDGLDDLHIGGISSWQATSQTEGRSVYVQAVIPYAGEFIDEIEARQNGDLVIHKGYRMSDGQARYEEIARSSFDGFRSDRGASAFTLTVSGYSSGKPASRGSRSLTGIRSISTTGGKKRVRCNIDLFLQPGMTVEARGDTFRADYINFYVSQNDKFCEVSER